MTAIDYASLNDLFSSPSVAQRMREVSATSFDSAARFWRVPMEGKHLSLRLKEVLLFAMHGTSTALNIDAMRRHIYRALAVGATEADIVDVLISIAGVANHALYASVPILREEWQAAGKQQPSIPDSSPELEAAKAEFRRIRGFWNTDRDSIARDMPEYFAALTAISTEAWERGSLTRKEREFVCIAIDCTVTHSYPPGLRIHVRNAIALGATQGEIQEIFQLAALLGLEGYVQAAEAMFGIRSSE